METSIFTQDQKNTTLNTKKEVKSPNILIVEDDLTMRELIEYSIKSISKNASLMWAFTEEAAETVIKRKLNSGQVFNVIIADVFLSGHKTGIELWNRYSNIGSKFVMISAIPYNKFLRLIDNSEKRPIFLQKPIDPLRLADAIKVCI